MFLVHRSPVAREHAQNERRCINNQEFLAQFVGTNDLASGTSTGVLSVSAPPGTSVTKTTWVLIDGVITQVSISCGPTDQSGIAECPLTLPGLITPGLPVTNVFTLANGSTVTTYGTTFCNDPTIPVGSPC